MKILLIDNFDSFTYNIYQLISVCCIRLKINNLSIDILRNNDRRLLDITSRDYEYLIIGPGPGSPINTGHTTTVFEALKNTRPILGICLGHQFIAAYYGANIIKALKPMHGKSSVISPSNSILFRDTPQKITVARYHSLIIENKSISNDLTITAVTEDNEIMAIENKSANIFGIQFHPESFLTTSGDIIMKNFLEINPSYYE